MINVNTHSDENVGSKGLSVPNICLCPFVRLLLSIKALGTIFCIKFFDLSCFFSITKKFVHLQEFLLTIHGNFYQGTNKIKTR